MRARISLQQLQRVQPDVVFNALHGRWGEDGCVQGLLEWMRIPYTHSGVLSSALAMDKEKTKEVFRAEGLPVVESLLIARADLDETHPIAPPYVIKPNNEGSSVGVYLVEAGASSPAAHVGGYARYRHGRDLCAGPRADHNRSRRSRLDGHGYFDRSLV